MSFLKDLENFSKDKLKTTDTKVVTITGKVSVEKRTEDGKTSEIQPSQVADAGMFFVIDDSKDPKVNKVVDYLYISSQDAAHEWDELKNNGIGYILNAALGVSNSFPQDFEYLNLEIYDTDEQDIIPFFEQAEAFISKGVSEQKGVLVHW
jgi:hypothetical protein